MQTLTRSVHHLWPIKTAAETAGLNVELFVSAVERGQLGDTEILVIGGQRERFVRATSLMDFLAPKSRAEKFAAAHADALITGHLPADFDIFGSLAPVAVAA